MAKENREEILAQSNDMTPVAGTDHAHLPDVVRGSGEWAGRVLGVFLAASVIIFLILRIRAKKAE